MQGVVCSKNNNELAKVYLEKAIEYGMSSETAEEMINGFKVKEHMEERLV